MTIRTLLFALACAAFGVLISIIGPKALEGASEFFRSEPKSAVLNLNRVVRANEIELASRGLGPEALQKEAEVFAERLKTGIEELQKQCRCTLFVSSAVISPHSLPDYTEDLLKLLSLSEEKAALGLEKLARDLKGDVP